MPEETAPQDRQLRQWVAERIRADIVEGRLLPGEWLRQARLARIHGVSQTPVREALKQLAAEGMVEFVPYRGVRVAEFSPEDVEDLYACRAVIEAMAARHAAARITAEKTCELRALHEAMLGCDFPAELARYRELNRRFHEAVFTASRRPYLIRTLTQLWSAFPSMLWSSIPRVAPTSVPARDDPDRAEHEEIVAAFEAMDPDRAERAVRSHIETAGRTLRTALEDKE